MVKYIATVMVEKAKGANRVSYVTKTLSDKQLAELLRSNGKQRPDGETLTLVGCGALDSHLT